MLQSRLSKIIFFLIIPVAIAGISFVYNFAAPLFSPGPLTLGHTKYNNSCFECHAIVTSMSGSCLDCHEELKKSIKSENGFHAIMPEDGRKNCMKCHTDHKGKDQLIITDFRGEDELVDLVKNTAAKRKPPFNAVPREFNKKYAALWTQFKEGRFSWKDNEKKFFEGFEHSLTGYTLVGKHAQAKCEKCHTDIKDFEAGEKKGIFPEFNIKKLDRTNFCFSCHEKNDKDKKKGHEGKYGKKCGDCHSIGGGKQGWKILHRKIRDHHTQKDHEHEGKHKKVKCQKCHTRVPFKKEKDDQKCIACHKKLDEKIHDKSLGEKCETCHTPESFRKPIFDHQKTGFILYYSHKKLHCGQCHDGWDDKKGKKKVYKKIKNTSCIECHAKDDVHRGAFKNDCARCHKETYWADVIQR